MKTILASLLVLLIAGCSYLPFMPDVKVEGLQNLNQVVIVVADDSQIGPECAKLGQPWWTMAMACTNINLDTWTATTVLGPGSTTGAIEHEREHRMGYWHDNGLQEYYDNWKARQK